VTDSGVQRTVPRLDSGNRGDQAVRLHKYTRKTQYKSNKRLICGKLVVMFKEQHSQWKKGYHAMSRRWVIARDENAFGGSFVVQRLRRVQSSFHPCNLECNLLLSPLDKHFESSSTSTLLPFPPYPIQRSLQLFPFGAYFHHSLHNARSSTTSTGWTAPSC